MLDKKAAKRLMSLLLAKSGWTKWKILDKRWLEFYDNDARAIVCSRNVQGGSISRVECSSRNVVDVARKLEELSKNGMRIFVASHLHHGDQFVVTIVPPFKNLEELLVEADLAIC